MWNIIEAASWMGSIVIGLAAILFSAKALGFDWDKAGWLTAGVAVLTAVAFAVWSIFFGLPGSDDGPPAVEEASMEDHSSTSTASADPEAFDGASSTPSSPERVWQVVWEGQVFSFPPAEASRVRLINFDTEEVPEVWDMGSDDFGRTRGAAAEGSHIDFPADIAYTNSYHGRLSLMPNRRLGMSEVNQPSPEECWSHATSRSIDISDSEFTDDDLSTNRIQVGDGMCLITDQENLVWWQVTETIDNDPHPFNTMGGHTIEGVATLWERS